MENTTMNLDSIIAALVAQYITPIIKAQIAEQMEIALDGWENKKLQFLTNHVVEAVNSTLAKSLRKMANEL